MQSSNRAHWWELQSRRNEKRFNYSTTMWRHNFKQQIWHRVWGNGPLSPWVRIFRTGNHSIRGKCLLITNKYHGQLFLCNIIYLVILWGCIQLSPMYICKEKINGFQLFFLVTSVEFGLWVGEPGQFDHQCGCDWSDGRIRAFSRSSRQIWPSANLLH